MTRASPTSARAPAVALLALCMHKLQNTDVPKSITIRDVPDRTSEELSARAAATGRSLQEYLRSQLVRMAEAPDAEAWLARVRERKAATGTRMSAQDILTSRDADRR